MKVKIKNFEELVRKSTFNYSIETTSLQITKDKINSAMVNRYNTAIAVLDVDNNVIKDMDDMKFDFNFLDPDQHLKPFLDLIDEEEATLKVYENRIALFVGRQKQTIHFCRPQTQRIFRSEATLKSSEYFTQLELEDNMFFDIWKKIKRLGTRFGKIYFNVKKDNFTIEATDKTNKFANSLKLLLAKVDSDELSLCFDFNDLASLIRIIDNDFALGFSYDRDHQLGLLHASKNDDSENFFLMSKKE